MRERYPLTRFSDLVDAYATYRYRDYPPKVLDVMFHSLGDPRKLVVADVGAGVGISSEFIASRGSRVIAIEPNDRMREHSLQHPLIEWKSAVAESTGLETGSVDVVATFQSFHWFDPAASLAEFRRVARHRIVSVQYEHEESDRVSEQFETLLRAFSLDDCESLRRHALETFAVHAGGRMRTSILNVDWERSREQLLGYLESISFVPHTGEAGLDLRAQANLLFDRFSIDGILNLPLRLYVLALDT